MAKISTNAEINSIRLKEQASAPDTPASGYFQVYVKTDGKLYYKDDAGTEVCLTDKMTNPMTTAGDIIYGSASGAPTRLAAGTENYVLTMGVTNPEWAAAAGGGAGIPVDGWVDPSETWTYASATTFTVPGDQTSKYTVGLKIKLTQTTVKYFYVLKSEYSDPNTTVTISGGVDYTLANAAISDNYYSRVQSPSGFPDWFEYTPTFSSAGTSASLGNGTLSGIFRMDGKLVTACIKMKMGSTTTYGAPDGNPFRWLLPTSGLGIADSYNINGAARFLDSGTAHFTGSTEAITTSGVDYMIIYNNNQSNAIRSVIPFTWATNDEINGTLHYLVP